MPHRFSFRHARQTQRLVGVVAVVMVMNVLGGCIDPRPPSLTDAGPEFNLPPIIDRTTLTIPPSPEPVQVQLGEGCGSGATFAGLVVEDSDLRSGGALTFRWNFTRQVGAGTVGPSLLASGTAPNTAPPPARVPIPSFELTEETLLKIVADVQGLVEGERTHLLEFHVTDGAFAPGTDSDVNAGDGADYLYWLVKINKDDCNVLD